jgi:hypothetical protein
LSNLDGFVKSPTSALRFISLPLRRTLSTHPSGTALEDDTKFARLEFGAFYFAITILTFYEIVNLPYLKKSKKNQYIPQMGDVFLSAMCLRFVLRRTAASIAILFVLIFIVIHYSWEKGGMSHVPTE